MTSTTRLATIQSIYNKRAPTYDSEEGFHPNQAADYFKWMNLKPGLNILDLACGTGSITIAAARAIGPSGKAFGVDISGDSISIAKAKAESQGLQVKFIQHDIAALHELRDLEEGFFDVITCASAFVLLEDQTTVVRGWAKLLKRGGRIMFDVPLRNSMVGGWVLNVVGGRLGIPVAYDQTKLDSKEKVENLLTEAGLDFRETFTTGSYRDTELDAGNADDLFESIVGRKGWFEGVYSAFNDPTIKESAKSMFREEMQKLANAEGKIQEKMRFTMAVGKIGDNDSILFRG